MTQKYPGGFVTLTPPTLDPALGAATQGIWTLDQALTAAKLRSWPMYDPYYNNVVLNLHGNGTNGAQNNTFLDSSTNNFTITRNGNTTQGTFSPYGQNWGVTLTSGTDLGLYMAAQSAFSFGTGDFTFELWVYLVPTGANQVILDWRPATVNGAYPTLYLDYSNSKLGYYANTANRIVADTTFAYNTWNHVAVSRASGTTRMFINGVVQSTTYADSTNYGVGTNRPSTSNGFAQDSYMLGATISNLRIIKGQAVYTTSFTPSTTSLTTTSQGATASNVSLLTAQSNRFIDNSSNSFTVNTTGTMGTTRFSPFLFPASYTPSTIGGSGYFDGTGDYLTAASSAAFAFGTGDFTVEAWVYITADSSAVRGFWQNGASDSCNLQRNTSGNLQAWDGADRISTTSVPSNAWAHVAFTRASGTARIFVNGVQALSWTSSVNYSASSTWVAGYTAGGTNTMTGYISDLRILKGTALYTGSYTPPTAPLTAITNTSLLLSNTNSGIVDNAMMNDLETVGNAQISTSVKKYGTGSMYFDGTGDYLISPNTLNGDLSTGDFTIEYWFNCGAQTNPSYLTQVGTLSSASPSKTWRFGTNLVGAAGVYFAYHNGTTFVDVTFTTTNYNNSTWHHAALTRSSGTVRAFIDGVQVGSNQTITQDLSSGQKVCVGAELFTPTYYTGYIDDLRITKGVARYVANFTPPTSQLQDQ